MITLMITALALTATTAWAQGAPMGGHVTGIISHIDPATRTIYLVDGRMLRVEPGTVLTVNGREIAFEALQPGSNLTAASRAAATTTTDARSAHPPVDVSGTVARVDRQSGVITFQDGRTVRITGQSMVWQPARADALQPGVEAFVENAQPVFAAAAGQASAGQMRMGRIVRVDPANALIMLDDGTFVRVMPTTKMHMASKNLTISELKPGDEVVIRPHTGAMAGQSPATAGSSPASDAPSALPRQDAFKNVVIDAADIQVMRRPQSP